MTAVHRHYGAFVEKTLAFFAFFAFSRFFSYYENYNTTVAPIPGVNSWKYPNFVEKKMENLQFYIKTGINPTKFSSVHTLNDDSSIIMNIALTTMNAPLKFDTSSEISSNNSLRIQCSRNVTSDRSSEFIV